MNHDLWAAAIAPSKLINYRIIRPFCHLAKYLISHRVSAAKFVKLYNTAGPFRHQWQTSYFQNDLVLVVSGESMQCYRETFVESVPSNDLELEYAGYCREPLSPKEFPMALYYNHERRAIQFVKTCKGYKLVLEILVPFLREETGDIELLDTITSWAATEHDDDYPPNVISLSYSVVLDKVHNLTTGDLATIFEGLR